MEHGLIVSDSRKSAISSSSLGWAKELNAKVIFASDFPSPKSLLKTLVRNRPSWTLFSWREALFDIMRLYIHRDDFQTLQQKSIIGISIPDHLGQLNNAFSKIEDWVIAKVNFCTTTSPKLQQIYLKKFPNLDVKLLLDMPNHELLTKIKNENLTRDLDVIWVGNTYWGRRQGVHDHKGYEESVLPLMKSLKGTNSSSNFCVIDRSQILMSHEDVLRLIARSHYLVQFSKSEGTGLPVLEAMALGTIPVTTDVGIASMALGKFGRKLIVTNYLEAAEVIKAEWNPELSHSMEDNYALHVVKIQESLNNLKDYISDSAPRQVEQNQNESTVKGKSSLTIKFIWLFRFFRSRIRP